MLGTAYIHGEMYLEQNINEASFEHVKVCPTPFFLNKTFIIFVFNLQDTF